ncbi:hypothetical protein FGSG_12881 [Fusarium graminearum PH-1]|uniref:hypothetical protein n=1 Tax=Gibberella zeae (strain ATCC MYA-4620 / CBS 123657 / FGSC 9075 / NRRL 31084 / PH-1) TaxID=229533 RepID=UPI00021F266D|nr:hypothetical protein FGSG_12881 [Fusarium graminearum PH-1]ESU12230.1 hypothetical protein FGSG_12881 [Fusarium graminearum PH-1]|eukprot:XP_011324806.1 hypothetical protein FGSG_12881 [Fusarium graminearum PH-1]
MLVVAERKWTVLLEPDFGVDTDTGVVNVGVDLEVGEVVDEEGDETGVVVAVVVGEPQEEVGVVVVVVVEEDSEVVDVDEDTEETELESERGATVTTSLFKADL